MTGHPARDGRYVEPEQWYAQLATQYTAAGALITDPEGHVLLVKPNYRDYWVLPGGMLDDGETPEDACARELKEELGLDLPVGRLLVIDWAPAYGRRPRPIAYFLFDAGTLHDSGQIQLQESELDDWAFIPLLQATAQLPPHTAARLPAAVTARNAATTIYLPRTGTLIRPF